MVCSRLNFSYYAAHVISGLYHCSIILNVNLYDGAVEFYGLRVRQMLRNFFTWLAVQVSLHRQLVLETIFDVAEL